jgi:hypothetical protein
MIVLWASQQLLHHDAAHTLSLASKEWLEGPTTALLCPRTRVAEPDTQPRNQLHWPMLRLFYHGSDSKVIPFSYCIGGRDCVYSVECYLMSD